MWRLMYGYRTVMEADWKRNTSFIQIKCLILKSSNIQARMDIKPPKQPKPVT